MATQQIESRFTYYNVDAMAWRFYKHKRVTDPCFVFFESIQRLDIDTELTIHGTPVCVLETLDLGNSTRHMAVATGPICDMIAELRDEHAA